MAFWKAMQSNDFVHASSWLSEGYEGYWPQSRELIRGRTNFIEINRQYPAAGRWQFDIRTLIAEGSRVVSEVDVTDGVVSARVITFHQVERKRIRSQLEYWPDPFPTPAWRARYVEVIDRPNFPD
ncbi:nuclear transport factor 2 family protein [Roseobacter sinensis]|uniref:Nuclear transport factor 2 family protein n=1 Tax=Roseobacter sinensis TaxID=2931391 RepID=A0ABT3BEJ0_9RHOB|nr:nuclear transport factor 2 family protein [Roseobacter sp. WL0113]